MTPEHPVWSIPLKELRRRAGISQRLAAEIARVQSNVVRRWENGEEPAPPSYRMALAALHTEIGQ